LLINHEINDDECRKMLDEKYNEIISILRPITTDWDRPLRIIPKKYPSWKKIQKESLTANILG